MWKDKTLRNWPHSRHGFWKKVRLQASNKALHYSLSVKRSKLAAIQSLQMHAQYVFDLHEQDLTACPEGIDVKVAQIVFGELYFIEDFEKVAGQLERLNRNLSPRFFIREQGEIKKWFESVMARSFPSGTMRLGPWLFSQKQPKKSSPSCKSILAELNHVSASLVSLAIIVEPSSAFDKSFQSIISKDSSPENDISGFNLFRGITRVSTSPAIKTRKSEIDDLILAMNNEVVTLLRSEINAGLCLVGPLPSIEVLTIDQPIGFFKTSADERRKDKRFRRGFWTGLGKELHSDHGYFSDIFHIYKVIGRGHYELLRYQLVISQKDYKAGPGADNDFIKLKHHISYFVFGLMPLIVVRHFVSNLQKKILAARNDLNPAIVEKATWKHVFPFLGKIITRISLINELRFQHVRLCAELADQFTRNNLISTVGEVTRQKYSQNDKGNLASDLFWQIDEANSFNVAQLDVLKSSYETLLTYKSAKATYVLNFILLVLTFAVLLPEKIRDRVWDILLKWITSWISVTN